MSHYLEALSFIQIGNWGAAAESIAYDIYRDEFLGRGSHEQTAFVETIARHLLIENLNLNHRVYPSPEKPIETRLAQEIYEKTCSHLGFDKSDPF